MTKTVEYRVRPVIRYHVTRFEIEKHPSGACRGGCESLGEFDNELQAFKVADALCHREIERNSTEIYKYKTLVVKPAEPFSDKEKINEL